MNITILGEGAWGSALAHIYAQTSTVTLWCQNPEIAHSIIHHKTNAYVPSHIFNQRIKATHNLQEALNNAEWIIVTTPVRFVRSVLTQCSTYAPHAAHWIMACKGIEHATLALPSTILQETINPCKAVGILSGPSFAYDCMADQPTRVIYASSDCTAAHMFTLATQTATFTYQISSDYYGVQLAGALKNVYALGMGLIAGFSYSDNTQALFMTAAYHELTTFLQAAGSPATTAASLAGLGDLILTSYSDKSRNRCAGYTYARNLTTSTTAVSPEGLNTLTSINNLADKLKISAPIAQAIYACIVQKSSVHTTLLDYLLHSDLI